MIGAFLFVSVGFSSFFTCNLSIISLNGLSDMLCVSVDGRQ